MPYRPIEKPHPVSMQKDTPKLTELVKKRRKIPSYTSRTEILKAFRDNQAVFISGETGYERTTQVSQFILEEAVETREPLSRLTVKHFFLLSKFPVTKMTCIESYGYLYKR